MWVQVTVALCAPGAAWAFDETTSEVRRTTVDAGVHVPVLTKAPALLEFAKAVYPADAQAQGLTSAVKLLVTILPDGSVGEVSVREPVGNGFDEAAIEALHRFRFSPAELDNVPAAVQIEYVYHFVLDVPVDAGPGDAGAEPVDAGPPPNDATIIGTVIARGSRKRVPAAIAQCDNWPDLATTSDEQGKFVLNVPSGDCALRIAATDFMLYQTKQTLEHGETKEVNFCSSCLDIFWPSFTKASICFLVSSPLFKSSLILFSLNIFSNSPVSIIWSNVCCFIYLLRFVV